MVLMTKLKRSLGLFDSTLLGLGAIIGAGIYVVIGIAAGLAGPAVVLSIILAGIAAGLSSMSFSELGSSMPREGGPYEFSHKIISPFMGFMNGWLWLSANIITSAAVSLGFAGYLVSIFPFLPIKLVAITALLFFSVLNIIGVKQSAQVNDALVILKVLLLALFVVMGAGSIKLSNFSPFLPLGSMGVLQAAAMMFFAYTGYARVTTVAEEVKDPGRTIPASIFISLLISTIIYILTGFVTVGLEDWKLLGTSSSPLALAISNTGIPWAVGIVSLGAMLATMSVMLTSIFGVSRVMFAMARNNELPKKISEIHKTRRTPVYSIIISTIITILFAYFFDLELIVGMTSLTILIVHGITNISAILSRIRYPNLERPFKIPLFPLPPVLGALFCFGLALTLPPNSWIMGLATIGLGVLYYLFFRPNR